MSADPDPDAAMLALLLAEPDPLRALDTGTPGSLAHRLEGKLLAVLHERHGYSWNAVAKALGRPAASSLQSAVARHPELSRGVWQEKE